MFLNFFPRVYTPVQGPTKGLLVFGDKASYCDQFLSFMRHAVNFFKQHTQLFLFISYALLALMLMIIAASAILT